MNELITRFISAQHGFVRKKSLVTHFISYIEEVLAAVDSGNFTAAGYFDIAQYFDSFPHSSLITKISKYGLDEDFVNFL